MYPLSTSYLHLLSAASSVFYDVSKSLQEATLLH